MAALITTSSLIDDPAADRFDFAPAPQHAPVVGGFNFFAPKGNFNGPYWYGTTGDDLLRPTGGSGTYVGGPGDDWLAAPNNLVRDNLYGDHLTKGFPGKTIGSYSAFGDDVLEFGLLDHAKSGKGNDTYVFHHVNTKSTMAHTWMNLNKDHLIVANEPEIASVKYRGFDAKTKTAEVGTMVLVNDAVSGPVKGQQWIMQHFDPSNANLDTGKLVIKYDGAAPGLDDIQDWWDGFNASHPDFLL